MKQQLSKNDIWELSEKLSAALKKSDLVTPKDRVELVDETIYTVNGEARFFIQGDKVLPTLKSLLVVPTLLKHVVVDMGAIPFIMKGADIMRPGIKDCDAAIEKGELVVVVDEKHSKPLCVGMAVYSGVEIKALSKGPCVKNLHYVGDKIWNM